LVANLYQKKLQKGEDLLSSRITTSQEVQVNNNVKEGVKVIKSVSSTTVYISEKIVSGIATVAKSIGSRVALQIMKVTNKVGGETGNSFISGVKEVGSVSITTALSIWSELENAGVTLITQTGKGTSDLLEKKYGTEVGDLTRDSFESGLNIFKSVSNINSLGFRKVSKKVILHSGKGALKEIIRSNEKKINIMCPDLETNHNNNDQNIETIQNDNQTKENNETNQTTEINHNNENKETNQTTETNNNNENKETKQTN